MQLSPREVDKLLITQVGTLAQRRLARGLRLNHAEALALIASVLHELIRDGAHSVAELMALGATLLGRRHVLPSVPHTLTELQVEGTFRMGTYLVTVHNPIRGDDGDLARALYGSFLPVPEAGEGVFPWPAKEGLEAYEDERLMPGAVVAVKGEAGRVVLGGGGEAAGEVEGCESGGSADTGWETLSFRRGQSEVGV
ncbi:Urease [Friedmanniomyces endolithicus]|nr:Urease [Friedmanniomyces endolithicus]